VAAKNFHATNEKSSHGVKGPRFFSGALGAREAEGGGGQGKDFPSFWEQEEVGGN
jgi:hypothetical protein